MSKEQTPMEELRENIERSEVMNDKVKLVLLAFDWDTLYKKEEQFIRAKVLEALEPIIKECKKVIDSPNHLESTKGFASIIWYELEQSKQK